MAMVKYIIDLANKIIEEANTNSGAVLTYTRLLPEELDRLDPRDFLPDARYKFVVAKGNAWYWGNQSATSSASFKSIVEMASSVIEALKCYGGENSKGITRSFNFMKDKDLRKIVERDYRELRLQVYPSGAWKSSVILAGSILEAILFDHLTNEPATRTKAEVSKKAPKDKHGKVLDLFNGDWKLYHLIEVAADIGMIPLERAKSFDQVLRDYRNFVHPKKEIRSQHQCNEAEAMMAVGALDGICNIL